MTVMQGDPATMTPSQRRREIAAILARGVLRLRQCRENHHCSAGGRCKARGLLLRQRFSGFGGQLKVLIRHLQVVPGGDGLGVADPGTDDVQWILLSEFRLAGGAEVLPELGPGSQAGALNDALELDAEVRGALTVAGDDAVGAWGGLFENFALCGRKSIYQVGMRDQPKSSQEAMRRGKAGCWGGFCSRADA